LGMVMVRSIAGLSVTVTIIFSDHPFSAQLQIAVIIGVLFRGEVVSCHKQTRPSSIYFLVDF